MKNKSQKEDQPDKIRQRRQEQDLLHEELRNEELRAQADQIIASKAELEPAYAWYRELFDEAPDGYIVTDIEGRIQNANQAAARLFGHSTTELTQYRRYLFSDFLPALRNQWEAMLASLQSKATPRWVGEVFPQKGKPFLASVSAAASFDADGRITIVRWLIRDITELQHAEEALRQRATVDEAIMANMGEGLYTLDTNGLVTSVNPAAERLLGFSRAELMGRNMHETIHYLHTDGTPFPAEKCPSLEALRRGESVTEQEDVFIRKGREFFPVVYSSAPIQLSGRTLGLVVVFRDITAQKRAQEQLRQVAQLPAENPHPVLRVSKDGRLLYANRVATEKLIEIGWRAGEPVPIQFRSLIAEAPEFGVAEQDIECAAGRIFSFVVTPIKDAGYVNIYGRDVTEKRMADEALRESEQRLRGILDNLQDAYFQSDLSGRLTLVSPSGVQMFGYNSAQEMIGLPAGTLYAGPQDRALLQEILHRSRRVNDFILRGKKKDGTVFWTSVNFQVRRDSTGQIIGTEGAVRDITERTRAKEALQESQNRFRLLFESIDEGVCVIEVLFDESGKADNWRFLEVNPAFEKHTGIRQSVGKTVRELISNIEATWFDVFGKVVTTGESVRLTRHSGALNRWFDLFALRIGKPEEHKVAVLFTDITAQKHAGEALRASEFRFRSLFDSSPDAVFLTIPDGRIEAANPAACAMLGFAEHELRALGRSGIFDMNDPRISAAIEERQRTGYVRGKELTAIRKNGEQFPVEIDSVIVPGEPSQSFVILRDISDRKRAEKELRESEAKYRNLFENIGEGVIFCELVWDEGGQIRTWRLVEANPPALKTWGKRLEDVIGKTADEIFPGITARYMGVTQKAVDEGIPHTFEDYYPPPMDQYFRFTVVPFGKYIVVTGADITYMKKGELSLRESEERLRALGDNLPDSAVYQYVQENDGKVRFLYFSAGVERLTGVRVEDVLHDAAALNRLIPPEYLDKLLQAERRSAEELSDFEIEVPMRRLDGQVRWMRLHARPHRLPDGATVWDGVQMDITERKRVEDELAAAKQSAEQANQAKDHFLAVLSHELRTPLTPVVMGVSMLQERPDFDRQTLETLEMVRRNAEVEALLIDDLLDVTRIARGKIELNRNPVDIRMVIQRAVEVCQPDIDARRLHFGVDFGPATPYWVNADASRLQQVFWNLLKNAIKFTPHGGCVGIRCRQDEEHVVCEVSDSGIGIEREALSRIFNAFEQAEQSHKRQFGGLGLGLAISKTLIEMHDGQIEAHSDGPSKGATFRIRLPLSVRQPEVGIPTKPQQSIARPLSILLVEDHGVTAQMIRMVLSEKGHMVEIAGDISTALELADRNSFDLLLSDLGLPDGSGHDLMRELRKRGYNFPGIALSGYGQEDDIRHSYEAGFSSHLTKPVSREAIFAAVAAAAADNGNSNPDFSITRYTPVNVPIFDADTAIKRCFGKREILEEMVNVFPTESTKLLSRMRAGLANRDIADIGRAAHRLKGTVVYLGAQPTSDAAQNLEQATKSGDLEAVEKAIIGLEKQVDLLKKTLASQAA